MPITALPVPPSRADSTTFAARGDTFLGALPAFVTEANTLETNVNAKEASATTQAANALTSANNSASSASAAATSATNAATSATNAATSSGAAAWVSGTTYAIGDARYSPATKAVFRRLTAGAGTTDPSADATNWGSIVQGVGSGGTGATTAAQARTNLGAAASGANTDITSITGNAATATTAGACTGNAATATTAGACTGNSATATSANNCTGNAATATLASTATLLSATAQTALITGRTSGLAMSQDGGAALGSFVCRASGAGDANLAGLTFYNDSYAIKLGVRGDGYFSLGGWSRPGHSFYSDPSGNFVAAGNVSAYSDPRLKEDAVPISGAIQIIKSLNGVRFTWRHGFTHTEAKAGKRDIGVLADEVEAVLPELVVDSINIEGESFKTVCYEKLVPVLIQAIKEQQTEIESLRQLVNQLIDKVGLKESNQ